MAVLAVIGIEALRRLIGREFPDAEFRPLGIGDRVARGPRACRDRGSDRGDRPEAVAGRPTRAVGGACSSGALTDEEFAAAKAAQLAEH